MKRYLADTMTAMWKYLVTLIALFCQRAWTVGR